MHFKPDSQVIVQGITEHLGSLYTARMKAYGTSVVAGVSPGQGGQILHDIPIFDLVEQALPGVGSVDTSIIFVKPYLVLDAALEAIAAGIRRIIIVTGGVPPLDMVRLLRKAEATATTVLGPGSSGIIIPGKLLFGTQESQFYIPGIVGLISHSGILTSEVALALTQAGLGQSIGINLGTDAMVGSSFREWLPILAADKNTKVIVLVSQTGSRGEAAAAEYIAEIDKPVIAYVAGRYAPAEKPLGDAATLTTSQMSVQLTDGITAQNKIAAFKQAKIPVAERLSQIPDLVKKALKK